MKGKFTLLTLLAATISFYAKAQSAGDYRSNIVTPNVAGIWSDPSIWEVYDGSAWNPAVTAPTSANGLISIRSTDSVIVNSNVTIDQVEVNGGATPGVLVFFNGSTPFVATLANGAGDDIVDRPVLLLFQPPEAVHRRGENVGHAPARERNLSTKNVRHATKSLP